MTQGKFRALKVTETGRTLENSNGKKQDQQTISNPHQGVMDAEDRVPYIAALESLRRLGQKGPYLGQFVVPPGKRVLQNINDPVIADKAAPPLGNCVSR